jgi:hypothetical protein
MEKVSIKMCERKRGTTNQMTTSDASSFDKKMRLHRDTLAGSSSERLPTMNNIIVIVVSLATNPYIAFHGEMWQARMGRHGHRVDQKHQWFVRNKSSGELLLQRYVVRKPFYVSNVSFV